MVLPLHQKGCFLGLWFARVQPMVVLKMKGKQIMKTLNYYGKQKMAPRHSFHPNASLLALRKGYVAGIETNK